MKKIVSLTAALAAMSLVTAKADTIADWTFETSAPVTAGPFSPEIGSGSASGSHAGVAVYSSPAGNGSAHSFSANTWAVGDYWEFDFSTVNFTGVQISYDQTSSNTGPRDYGLFYSINGGAYTILATNSVLANAAPNPVWNATTASSLYTFTPALGGVLDNATTVSIRLMDLTTVSASGGAVAAGGTDRVDNFVVTATPVPEPTTTALGILGGLTCLVTLRRRS